MRKMWILLIVLLISAGSAAVIQEYFRVQNTVTVEGVLTLESTGGTFGTIIPGETVTDYFVVNNDHGEDFTANLVTQAAYNDATLFPEDWEGWTVTYTSDYLPLVELEGTAKYLATFRPGITTITRTVATDPNFQPGEYRLTTHCTPDWT